MIKVKLDDYEIRVLINGLYRKRRNYDQLSNSKIDVLLLQLLRKTESMKTCLEKVLHIVS